MRASGIGEVVERRNPGLPIGTLVEGMLGWSEYRVSNGAGLTLVEPLLPPTAMLSLLGLT
jgi:NADPH-dependent curcumin reductase CurA